MLRVNSVPFSYVPCTERTCLVERLVKARMLSHSLWNPISPGRGVWIVILRGPRGFQLNGVLLCTVLRDDK